MPPQRDTKNAQVSADSGNNRGAKPEGFSVGAVTLHGQTPRKGSNPLHLEQEMIPNSQEKEDLPLSPADEAEKPNQEGSTTSVPLKRNAFSALMAPKPKQPKLTPTGDTLSSPRPARPAFTSGLLNYITQPNTFPAGTIIAETPHTILIRDLYPKALVHLLMLPKDPAFYHLEPFETFQPTTPKHVAFLDLMREEAHTASLLAASELSRLVSPYSAACKARNDALLNPPSPSNDTEPNSIPPSRDFLPSIKIGIHASPSMSTLHIHIISEDNYSPHLKTKKHYNSFNTEFFVRLHEFPLDESYVALTRDGQERLIKGDMKCWRCGRDFGNKFKLLKEHLEEEYREWRKI